MKLFSKIILLLFLQIGLFAQNQKPNVIMLLVDDLKPVISAFGDETAITPNLDRLCSMGVRFERAYCNQAVCMASRYNLMLGSRSTSTGMFDFGSEFRDVYPDAVTLPQYFMQAGYHAEAIGKVFHIGHGNTNDVASWSIPLHHEKMVEYLLPESNNRELTREEALFGNTRLYFKDLPPIRELPRGAAWESPDVLDEAYGDGRLAKHAIERLRMLNNEPEKPFFMALGFQRPHLPFCVPKKYWDMYNPDELPMPQIELFPEGAPKVAEKKRGEIAAFKPIPEFEEGIYADSIKRKLIHGYYASVSYTDAQLGKVLDELERLKMLDNTILVLWGDHGWHLGDLGIWTKHTNFEQANHIPIVIVAPGIAKPGFSSQQLTETVDIYPTLAELAGLPKPKVQQPIDGTSLVPVLKNPATTVRDHAYHAFIRNGHLGQAIRTERYRLVRWTHLKNEDAPVFYELYDYSKDQIETKNIAKENPKIVAELEKILNKHPKAVTVPQKK